jgi:hypothetical protein
MEGFDVSVGRDGQFGTTEQGWEATRPHPGGRADGVANGGIEGGSPGPILVRGADNGDVDFIA